VTDSVPLLRRSSAERDPAPGTACKQAVAHGEEKRGPTASRETAFRVRLLETDGRGVTAGLRCFRPVVSAEKINAGDVPSVPLMVEGDKVEIPIGPHQWIEVEVILSQSRASLVAPSVL